MEIRFAGAWVSGEGVASLARPSPANTGTTLVTYGCGPPVGTAGCVSDVEPWQEVEGLERLSGANLDERGILAGKDMGGERNRASELSFRATRRVSRGSTRLSAPRRGP